MMGAGIAGENFGDDECFVSPWQDFDCGHEGRSDPCVDDVGKSFLNIQRIIDPPYVSIIVFNADQQDTSR